MQIIESSSVAGVIKRSFDRQGRNWIKHIVFPDFQRPYCWSLNDIQKILDDIDELRYSPEEERYRDEDEYYLGSICIMPARDSDDPERAHDMALLDGQQRLTSLMILARILYERAIESNKIEIRRLGAHISWIMGRDLIWKEAFLYSEPVTQQRIREVYQAIDHEYQQLESDAALDGARGSTEFSFYEKTLLRDLLRFRYILIKGRLAVTVLNDLKEAEQYFQGENNRGLPMSLLDILKAYHMRFESSPERLREIRRIWSAFNETPPCESDDKDQSDDALRKAKDTLAKKKLAVETHVIPALLMRCGIAPWWDTANIPQNAHLLKGIIGSHRGDRIVDGKLSTSKGKQLYDLLEPIQTGIGFFRALDQYRRIDEALDIMEQNTFNPASGLSLNYDQELILRLALIAWTDRFAPRYVFDCKVTEETLATALAADDEFRAFARHFARFLDRLRIKDKNPGAFVKLRKESLTRCLHYDNALTNLVLIPHRSETPAACKRAFLRATTPKAMATALTKPVWLKRYDQAYKRETSARSNHKSSS